MTLLSSPEHAFSFGVDWFHRKPPKHRLALLFEFLKTSIGNWQIFLCVWDTELVVQNKDRHTLFLISSWAYSCWSEYAKNWWGWCVDAEESWAQSWCCSNIVWYLQCTTEQPPVLWGGWDAAQTEKCFTLNYIAVVVMWLLEMLQLMPWADDFSSHAAAAAPHANHENEPLLLLVHNSVCVIVWSCKKS